MSGTAAPAGLQNAVQLWPAGAAESLYFSALVAAERALCWLVELDTDVATSVATGLSSLAPAGHYNVVERSVSVITTLTTTTRRYASRPLVTATTDSPASTPIDGRAQPVVIERYLDVGDGNFFAPLAVSGSGEIVLSNDDGELDVLADTVALEGRSIRLSVGGITRDANGADVLPKLADFSKLWDGVVDTIAWTRSQTRIRVTDDRLRLARAVQDTVYAGTGDSDGAAALAGVTKPLAFGTCRNVSPAQVDPFLLTYQFHDGEARAVDAVYDSGVPLLLHSTAETYADLVAVTAVDPVDAEAGDFTSGYFIAAPRVGCFRLGGLPAGRVTADIRGHGFKDGAFEYFSDGTLFSDGTGWTSDGGLIHAHTAPQVAITLLQRAGVANINVTQFAQLDIDEPRDVGLYLEPGGKRTVGDCLVPILNANGCLLFKSADGAYQLRRLQGPTQGYVAQIDESAIVAGSLERLALPWKQPWARWRVRYDRNWSVMADSEIAGAVSIDLRAFLRREASEAQDVDDPTVTIFPARAPGVLETALVDEADARAQAQRQLDLYRRGRAMFRLRCKNVAYRADLGDTVRVVHSRLGLSSGRNLLIVGIREDGQRRETELTLFG